MNAYAGDDSSISNIHMIGGSITGSSGYGMWVGGGDVSGVFNQDNLYGNKAGGVRNDGTNSIDAKNNWWGPGELGTLDCGKPGVDGNNGVGLIQLTFLKQFLQ